LKDLLIVGNFKQNSPDTLNYVKELFSSKTKTVICPNFLDLALLKKLPKNIFLGAQDVSQFLGGAHTGETSAEMLKKNNVSYCIVGHSERRLYLKEDNSKIATKIKNLLNYEIIPILCVGENTETTVKNAINKIKSQLKLIKKNQRKNIIVAYEPIWAIGTGKVAGVNHIENICSVLKDFGFLKVLYGGSVNETISQQILSLKSVDGLLVGSASLDVKKFNKIIKTGDDV